MASYKVGVGEGGENCRGGEGAGVSSIEAFGF